MNILDNELVRKRFYSKVFKTRKCWEWKACLGKNGYGRFGYDRETLNAHRVSWIIEKGKIPKGKWVLHRCDNKPCVRPTHLYLGGSKQNVEDAVSRKRLKSSKGEANGRSRLTWKIVEQIRAERNETGAPYSQLARRFGVSKSCIDHICSGRKWKIK